MSLVGAPNPGFMAYLWDLVSGGQGQGGPNWRNQHPPLPPSPRAATGAAASGGPNFQKGGSSSTPATPQHKSRNWDVAQKAGAAAAPAVAGRAAANTAGGIRPKRPEGPYNDEPYFFARTNQPGEWDKPVEGEGVFGYAKHATDPLWGMKAPQGAMKGLAAATSFGNPYADPRFLDMLVGGEDPRVIDLEAEAAAEGAGDFSMASPPVAMRRAPKVPATGGFGGNAQGSVVGPDLDGPDPLMGAAGMVNLPGQLNEMPAEPLGPGRALPQIGNVEGQAAPKSQGLMRALLGRMF